MRYPVESDEKKGGVVYRAAVQGFGRLGVKMPFLGLLGDRGRFWTSWEAKTGIWGAV